MIKIEKKDFGRTKEGDKVTLFEMSNSNGLIVKMLDYGCTIQSVIVPDRNGNPVDIVLGYEDVASYEEGTFYYGATVGRCANRIKGACFTLNGRQYQLSKNSEGGRNHVHGAYCKRMYNARVDKDTIIFDLYSPDGEEGYPGNVTVEIRYTLKEDNSLEINYKAKTDAPTLVNLTNHCYFNLNGHDGSTVLNHRVWLNSSAFSEYDEYFGQTGNIIPVDNTPLDFRVEETIGARFADNYLKFRVCTGYDHNMILDGKLGELKPLGYAKSDVTGITLEAFTTEPATQFYSGNFIELDPERHNKQGIVYPKNGGFCMEAQHYPDAINHPNFPSVVLNPGEEYTQTTIYRFY